MKNIQTFEKYSIVSKAGITYHTEELKTKNSMIKIPVSETGIMIDNKHINWEDLEKFIKQNKK